MQENSKIEKPYIEKILTLLIWGFGWDRKNEPKIQESLESRKEP
jgi:hypothetical protein